MAGRVLEVLCLRIRRLLRAIFLLSKPVELGVATMPERGLAFVFSSVGSGLLSLLSLLYLKELHLGAVGYVTIGFVIVLFQLSIVVALRMLDEGICTSGLMAIFPTALLVLGVAASTITNNVSLRSNLGLDELSLQEKYQRQLGLTLKALGANERGLNMAAGHAQALATRSAALAQQEATESGTCLSPTGRRVVLPGIRGPRSEYRDEVANVYKQAQQALSTEADGYRALVQAATRARPQASQNITAEQLETFAAIVRKANAITTTSYLENFRAHLRETYESSGGVNFRGTDIICPLESVRDALMSMQRVQLREIEEPQLVSSESGLSSVEVLRSGASFFMLRWQGLTTSEIGSLLLSLLPDFATVLLYFVPLVPRMVRANRRIAGVMRQLKRAQLTLALPDVLAVNRRGIRQSGHFHIFVTDADMDSGIGYALNTWRRAGLAMHLDRLWLGRLALFNKLLLKYRFPGLLQAFRGEMVVYHYCMPVDEWDDLLILARLHNQKSVS
ncbi:MAG: hypothetical protein ACFHX7_22090 [Pseudomonadota bacterium]